MSLRDTIAALVSAAPPDATVPVRWLAEQLATDVAAPSASVELPAAVDFTVPQVAKMFGRGASTIRTWCENETLPGAYRLLGREWRIPPSAVTSLQKASGRTQRPATPVTPSKTTQLSSWRDHLPRAS